MSQLSKYEAVRPFAEKYGGMYSEAALSDFVVHLSDQQLRDLREAYELLTTLSGSSDVSAWIDECARRKYSIARHEFTLSRQVANLLMLFEQLSQLHISPFDSGRLIRIERTEEPDWSTVPMELGYLIDPAKRYGTYVSEVDMMHFLERADEDDVELLARCAEAIRLNRHCDVVNEWLDSALSGQDDAAAWRVYSLIGLMDLAGLRIEGG